MECGGLPPLWFAELARVTARVTANFANEIFDREDAKTRRVSKHWEKHLPSISGFKINRQQPRLNGLVKYRILGT